MNSIVPLAIAAVSILPAVGLADPASVPTAGRLPDPAPGVTCWWALSSSAKIRPDRPAPEQTSDAVRLRAARNEGEAVQLVIRTDRELGGLSIGCGGLAGPGGARIAPDRIELLRAEFVDIGQPTDGASEPGLWPDPLLPVTGPVALEPGVNHAFWIRLQVPEDAAAGVYRGSVTIMGAGIDAALPLELTVYGFALPDRMSCVTAFGFSPGEVFRYHRLESDEHKRRVLDKYWASFAAHHVSPYDPAPLDPIGVQWPEANPPRTVWDDWQGLRIVGNETHGGDGALLVYDDQPGGNVTVTYQPLIPIPASGLRLRFRYRTAVPGQRFIVSLNNHDAGGEWMSGCNNDITLTGDGSWQEFDRVITEFPDGARKVQLHLRATPWTDAGEELGLVWYDDISLSDAGGGDELLAGGDFELVARTEPVVPAESLRVKFDFAAWDRAMARAMDEFHFNSFMVRIPGLGGGTFHRLVEPRLRGFEESDPEYPLLLDSYCSRLEDHLRGRGWLDRSYVYWFDEPSPDQYPFVLDGFAKLKRHCPGIGRMLTEQVEPGLLGGPNIWCPISNQYDHERAEERRELGERFWWYVCCGPKAPFSGLFIDHPAPEMRIWLWQTFKRGIEGVLVWQTNYWSSSNVYPDADRPQDPYADPMSWVRGYGVPVGERRPWGNGDGRFVYPPPAARPGAGTEPVLDGPVDSIRWEHLRDGIEDYEYLCILRRLLDERKGSLPTARHRELSALLEVPGSITRSLTEFAAAGAPIEQHRHRVARAIEGLR